MKTHFKFLHFEDNGEFWNCLNTKRNTQLGIVEWYPAWKQWVFLPSFDVMFSSDCLADIQTFLNGLEKP